MKLRYVIIETERLILKPIELSYSEIIYKEFTDEITQYMFPKPAESIEGVEDFINNSLEGIFDGSNLQLIIVRRYIEEFVGCIGLHNIGDNDPELGIWLKKEAHGNGYGMEAMSQLIKWAKERVGFDYLRYPVDRRNSASRRIPERNNGVIKREYKGKNQKGFEMDNLEFWIYR